MLWALPGDVMPSAGSKRLFWVEAGYFESRTQTMGLGVRARTEWSWQKGKFELEKADMSV